MLGTRVIMMGMSKFPGSNEGEAEAEIICAANHSIPLFWMFLFGGEDIEMLQTQKVEKNSANPSDCSEYPVLMKEKVPAVQLLNKRMNIMLPFLNEKDAGLIQEWLAYLTSLKFPVLAVDTYELWHNMSEPHSLVTHLTTLTQQLDELLSAPEATVEKLKKDGCWQENNSLALAGFGW
ncbi:MAG: hypothetical protein ACRBB6_08310 [Neptuniibacter sp.]